MLEVITGNKKNKIKNINLHLLTAARLLIASEWKTGFEMGTVQKQTKKHSLDDDEQKITSKAHPEKWRTKSD